MGMFTAASGAEDDLGDELWLSMDDLGQVIEDNAKRIVPYLSGDLERDIYHDTEDPKHGQVTTRVGSDLVYSTNVELGRRDMPNYPIQPYLKPAMLQARGVRLK